MSNGLDWTSIVSTIGGVIATLIAVLTFLGIRKKVKRDKAVKFDIIPNAEYDSSRGLVDQPNRLTNLTDIETEYYTRFYVGIATDDPNVFKYLANAISECIYIGETPHILRPKDDIYGHVHIHINEETWNGLKSGQLHIFIVSNYAGKGKTRGLFDEYYLSITDKHITETRGGQRIIVRGDKKYLWVWGGRQKGKITINEEEGTLEIKR